MLHIILPTTAEKPKMLKNMLASLAKYTEPCHLVVVVNSQEDWARGAVPPMLNVLSDNGWFVDNLTSHRRLGYVGACNRGWRACMAAHDDYVAILNDDLVFEGSWWQSLYKALQGDGVRLVGPGLKTIGRDGTWGQPEDHPYIEGWCCMFEARTLEGEENLFDPRFEPQFCEDMDLALRLGPRAIRQVDIPVKHYRSQTVGTGETREPYWSQNRRKLVEKWGLGPASSTRAFAPVVKPPTWTDAAAPQSQPINPAEKGWEVVP